MKNKLLLSLVLAFIFQFSFLFGQDIPKITVAGVTVQGNTTASEMIIKVNSGFIEGAVLTGDDIQDGIQKLWRLKLFKDIRVILEKETSVGAFIIIQVEEYPRLAKVQYSGNKKIKTKELEKDIPFIRGQVINPHTINRAIQKIEEKYADKGYYNAKIDVSTEPGAAENTIIVKIDITEGEKVRIRDIAFEGNEKFSDFRLRWQMKETKQRKWWNIFTDGKLDKEKYEEDKLNVLQFYRDHGYRDARFIDEAIIMGEDGKSIYLRLTIDEGVPYYFGDIHVTGNTIYSTDYLLKSLESVGISRGAAYREKAFESGVDLRVRSLYLDHGYLYAQVVPELTPRDKDTLDLNISIVENNKVYVRRIDIVGNDRTRDYVIRREMRIFPGDVFNREALIRSQSDIFRLNFFANVTPEIVPVDDENIDLQLIVEEKSSDRANVAIAYSELDGFVGSIGLDIANFRGTAQRVSTEYRRGAAYEYLSLGFTEPWLMGRPNTVGVNLYYSNRGNSATYYYYYDLGVKGITAHFGRRFRWPDSYFRGTWSITFSEKTYSNYENNEPIFLLHNPTGLEKTNANRLQQVISRDSRNRPEFPTAGSTVRLTTSLNGGLLGGHEEFVKNHFKSEWFMGLAEKLVLYQNYEMGIINTFGKYSVIPYDERFYMGGAGMVSYTIPLRGYDDQSIGPRSGNNPVGGQTMLKYSTELRYLLSENPTLYAFAFAETGQVWQNYRDIFFPDMVRSAGIGARIYMPMVGVLGFDLGYGLDDNNFDGKPDGWKSHFVFGMPF